jgi:hypothetical protein
VVQSIHGGGRAGKDTGKDHSQADYLTLEDFIEMGKNEADRPEIMIHVVKTLTGINIANIPNRVSEQDELKNRKIAMPTMSNTYDLDQYRETLPGYVRSYIYATFVAMWGREKKDRVVGADIDGVAVLLEENFTRNIKYIIGCECPFFGKMLYLYLGGGFDQAKITISQWFAFFS